MLTIIIFSTIKGPFRESDRSVLSAPSRQPLITSHQQGTRKRLVGRGGAAHPRRRGEPKEGSLLIKGLGAEHRLKIETEGDWHRFLQALTARLTAAPRRRAVEPSRESARLPMMRWDGKITSDKPSARHPSLITPSAHTHIYREKVITTFMHARTHTLRGTHTLLPPEQVMGLWLAEHPPVRFLLPSQSSCACRHTKYLWKSLHSHQPPSLRVISLNYLPSLNTAKYPCQWPLFYCCNWTLLGHYCYYTDQLYCTSMVFTSPQY